MLFYSGLCICTIFMSVLFTGCCAKLVSASKVVISKALPDPPAGLSFRGGVLGGSVAQVSNTSNSARKAKLYVMRNGAAQKKSYSFSIEGNRTEEIGILEMDWRFEAGDTGFIKVEGYSKRIYFEVGYFSSYKTWYSL